MEHGSADLILTLTAGLAAALALGLLALRLRLPPIAGYLLAGLLLGPHTPGFVADRGIAGQLAELGVILLMFGVGLHFHLDDLAAVRKVALTAALAQIAIITGLTVLLTRGMGWAWPAGLVFGIAVAVASTVVLTRVMGDFGDLQTRTGRIAVGWLVVEDILTVFVLVVLPAVFGQAGASNVPAELGLAVLKMAVLTVVVLVAGTRAIPWLLARVARTRSRELFTLTVLVIALGIAVGAARLFGVSMALGAFLAGMVVGQTDFSFRAASEALPMRDAFAVLFFVSVGMLFNPQQLLHGLPLTAATVALVFVAKPVLSFTSVVLLGYDGRAALRLAVARTQIGEFSFLLAQLGERLGILPEEASQSLIAVAIVSITFNPLVYGLVPAMERRFARSRWFRPRADGAVPAQSRGGETGHRAIVVGYGPVGQAVTRLMKERGIHPAIVELNHDTVRRLHGDGVEAIYGDAAQRGTLAAAGAASAGTLILSAPTEPGTAEIIKIARELNPEIRVLARSPFISAVSGLYSAGADRVFSGEGEVALAMTEAVLFDLGATPEQMDRERERVRSELYVGRRERP